MNPRLVPLVVGLLGAFVGLVALLADQPVLGLVAGVLAAGAGGLAFAVREDVSVLQRRIAQHETAEDGLRDQLDDLAQQLAMALQRHDELTEALKQARIALEQAESTMSADHSAAPVTPEAVEPVPPTPPPAIPAATRPAPAEVVVTGADDPAQLTDGESQLFSEAYFRVALDARIASARRHLRPVAVALLDLYEGVAGADIAPAEPARAAESIRETVRDADTACRLADGTYAVILEDTPENGAVWTVERVRRNLVSRHGSHTMWAGVACYPAHAFSADELLEQARVALVSAREWNQDRIEVAVAD